MLHPIRHVRAGKEQLCRSIFVDMPVWSGGAAAIEKIVSGIGPLPTFAVGAEGCDGGFVVLRSQFDTSCEIYVMGVRPEFQRRGLGRALIHAAEDFAWSHGYSLLFVKTPGPPQANDSADPIRRFYEATGFAPLDELPVTASGYSSGLIMVKTAPAEPR